jgi:hypothetical protein
MVAKAGMVQVAGVTYRVARLRRRYDVVRVLDDRTVGAFQVAPSLELVESVIPGETLREIAREALRRCIAYREPQYA